METVEIRCPKSMLNVAERAKKAKTAIYQALERVRDVGAAGSNPVIPTTSEWTSHHSGVLRHSSFFARVPRRGKKARSAHLFGCKRPHDGSLLLPPFCDVAASPLGYLYCLPFPKKSYCKIGFFLLYYSFFNIHYSLTCRVLNE